MNTTFPPLQQQQCANCRYAQVIGWGNSLIRCRRRPPVIVPDLLDENDQVVWGQWPMTGQENWCGEWTPKEEEA